MQDKCLDKCYKCLLSAIMQKCKKQTCKSEFKISAISAISANTKFSWPCMTGVNRTCVLLQMSPIHALVSQLAGFGGHAPVSNQSIAVRVGQTWD